MDGDSEPEGPRPGVVGRENQVDACAYRYGLAAERDGVAERGHSCCPLAAFVDDHVAAVHVVETHGLSLSFGSCSLSHREEMNRLHLAFLACSGHTD